MVHLSHCESAQIAGDRARFAIVAPEVPGAKRRVRAWIWLTDALSGETANEQG
jgi:hypothetical protein